MSWINYSCGLPLGKEGGSAESKGQNEGSTALDKRIGGQRGKNETGRSWREAQEEQGSCVEEEKEIMKPPVT